MECGRVPQVVLVVCLGLLGLSCLAHAKFFDDSSYEVRKRYVTPSCRKCLFRPDDWISCQTCYGRPGLVPYYGFNKRSQLESGNALTSYEDADSYGEGAATYDVEKRATFLTCRCCISLAARKCCDKCSLTPYYGKRSYEPSFLGGYGDPAAAGRGDCSCCDSETFNYECCGLHCAKRKRK